MNPRITALVAATILLLAGATSAQAAEIGTDGLSETTRPIKAHAAGAGSQDPNLVDQWAFATDRPMGMQTAWNQTVGGDVTVAVIDSGVAINHPDLQGNIWTNPGEIAGNGVDDENNGYVDDVHGWDFVASDSDPRDENGHGTHVAGIIGARGDNHIGGAGVAYRVKLMPIRVLDSNAAGSTTAVALGVRYAVDNGARIINLSLAGPSGADDLKAAILYAQVKGAVVVVAAGNQSRSLSITPSFPASYLLDNIVGVSATDETLGLADISNYGEGADIAAPGADILSTSIDGGYEWRTGTSMATPAVAGTLALIASVRPDLDGTGLRNALYAGASGGGLPVAIGSVNAAAALRTVIPGGSWKQPATTPAAKTTFTKATRKVVTPTFSAKRSAAKKSAAKKASTKSKSCKRPGKRASKRAKAKFKKCLKAKRKTAKKKAAASRKK